jgi:peptide-methionine (S)-S-oxide reductase
MIRLRWSGTFEVFWWHWPEANLTSGLRKIALSGDLVDHANFIVQGAQAMSIEKCTLGGGCFWCLDAVYRSVRGVKSVTSGYAGGAIDNPTYEQVCSGNTGHAEVVRIEFDNATISFEKILEIFFAIHDPTTLNKQGADVGTQYISVVFFENATQEVAVGDIIAHLAEGNEWGSPIVTEITPLERFYAAEEYHQDYFAKNPYQGYCRAVVGPKVSKFTKNFSELVDAK